MSEEILKRLVGFSDAVSVGGGLTRVDSLDKVLGKTRYTTDYVECDASYVKVFRSPIARGKVSEIDEGEAQKVQGVMKIMSSRDIPGTNLIGFFSQDQQVLCDAEVRCVGDPIVGVVARTPEAAKVGVDNVKCDIAPLPGVFSPDIALDPNSPKVHEKGNLLASYRTDYGEVGKGFKESDVVLESTYRTPFQEHVCLETEAALAIPENDGLIVIIGAQVPFAVERAVRTMLGGAVKNVRVVVPTVGGGFGGRVESMDQVACIAALAAFLTRKPALFAYDREESIAVTQKRHRSIIKRRIGATREGRLLAMEAEILLDAGAYAYLSPRVLFRTVLEATGPYLIPNISSVGKALYTNNPPAGAFRGFGSPQATFAAEMQMNELAEKLNMDPLELRLKNMMKEGEETVMGRLENVGLGECVSRVARYSDWKHRREELQMENKRNPRWLRGIGIGLAMHAIGLGPLGTDVCAAVAELNKDGMVVIKLGLVEMGQGLASTITKIASKTLNISATRITVRTSDTGAMPDPGPTTASRGTVMGGKTVEKACEKLRDQIISEASRLLGTEPSALVLSVDSISSLTPPVKKLSLFELATACDENGIKLKGEAWVDFRKSLYWDFEKGTGHPFIHHAFMAHVAQVCINAATGKVYLEKYYAIHDSGKIINTDLAVGQVLGGIVQGLGYTLTENLIVSEGRILNASLIDYHIPTTEDIPEEINFDFVKVEGRDEPKGLAEAAIVPVAAVIGGAMMHALGKSVREFPYTPENVWKVLRR